MRPLDHILRDIARAEQDAQHISNRLARHNAELVELQRAISAAAHSKLAA